MRSRMGDRVGHLVFLRRKLIVKKAVRFYAVFFFCAVADIVAEVVAEIVAEIITEIIVKSGSGIILCKGIKHFTPLGIHVSAEMFIFRQSVVFFPVRWKLGICAIII